MVSKRKFFLNSQIQHPNLWDFMQHSLENAQTSEIYRKNAVRSGDPELARLFNKLKDENHLNVHKARQFLSGDI